MKNQVKELQVLIKEKQISPEEASRLVGCSAVTVYRWLSGESTPTIPYQRKIKEGIGKIKAEYPDKKELSLFEILQEIKPLWKNIKYKASQKEKDRLMDLQNIDFKRQLVMLRLLYKKYNDD